MPGWHCGSLFSKPCLTYVWHLTSESDKGCQTKHNLLLFLTCSWHCDVYNTHMTCGDTSYVIWRQVQTRLRIVQIMQVPPVIEQDCVSWKQWMKFATLWHFCSKCRLNGLRFIWPFVQVDKFWISIRERERVILDDCQPIVLHFLSSDSSCIKCPCISQDLYTLYIERLHWACF